VVKHQHLVTKVERIECLCGPPADVHWVWAWVQRPGDRDERPEVLYRTEENLGTALYPDTVVAKHRTKRALVVTRMQ